MREKKGREEELVRKMKRYCLEVVGVSKTKLKGCGMKSADEATIIYSGVQSGRAKAGVAVLLSEKAQCVRKRIVTMQLVVKGSGVSFCPSVCPYRGCGQGSIKENLCAALQETMDRVPRGDRLAVLGDLNACVGCNCDVWGGVIGRHGEVESNDNRKRLLEFCACNEMLVIQYMIIIHRFTWECRGKDMRSIIDYFLVRKTNRADAQGVKVIRGAEIGSDHYLMVMMMKMKPVSAGSNRGEQGAG